MGCGEVLGGRCGGGGFDVQRTGVQSWFAHMLDSTQTVCVTFLQGWSQESAYLHTLGLPKWHHGQKGTAPVGVACEARPITF